MESFQRRDFLAAASAIAGIGALAPFSASAAAVPSPESDDPRTTGRGALALVNARILTLDPRRPTAQAALVRDGRIVALGSNREVTRSTGVPQFDAQGKTVVPGFIDHHCHVEDSCIVADHQLQLQGLTTKEAVIAKLREIAAATPKGQWIITQAPRAFFGTNYTVGTNATGREDLDRATQDHPIMMLFGIHWAAMNTLAFRTTGYWDADLPAKAVWKDGAQRRGTITQRDTAGRPTGIITEIWDYRPGYTVDQYKAALSNHFSEWFMAKGLTSITTLQNDSPSQFQALQQLQQEGGLPVRLRSSLIVPHAGALSDIVDIGWRTGFGSDMFRHGGVKFFIDGINGDATGNVVDDIKWNRTDLIAALTTCQRAGLQVIMHAVASKALDLAIDCIEAAQRAAPAELRHRIDHLSPQTDKMIERFKAAGVSSGITGRQVPVDTANPLARGRSHRFRSLYEQKTAILVLDAAGPGGNYHPMRGIANAMATVDQGGNAMAGEALTFEQALRLWTIVPAHNSFDARDKGTIELGKFGDFAVLSDDPVGKRPADVFDIGTVATIVGGNLVYHKR